MSPQRNDEGSSWEEDFDPNNPYTQFRLLAMRVTNLGKEKETLEVDLKEEREARVKLEERVAKMERSFSMGAGVLLVLPVVGSCVGLIFAYGKTIFAPWIRTP